MRKEKGQRKTIAQSTWLIILCWVVYTCSYLGKLGYNANITQIESAYQVSHSMAGMVSTFFFFAYGAGQIINGILCKKYPLRAIVFSSLIISALMNVLVGVSKDFRWIKYFWLVNGAALSILWPSLIRLLSENLEKEYIARAVVAMGTTIAVGTFLIYGISALFVAISSYVFTFLLAGLMLTLIAGIWMYAYPKLVTETPVALTNQAQVGVKKQGELGVLWVSICILTVFAIVNNFVKDGLTTWVPVILKEEYTLPDYASILLTMLLPIFAIFGSVVVVTLNKKIKDLVLMSAVLFVGSALCIGVVILCLPLDTFAVTVGSFAIVACLMAGVNNVITSVAPLYWKERVNSGMLAGVLNGFCYLGSTLSAYGIGTVADHSGWYTVFWLWLALCVVGALLACVYGVFKKSLAKAQPSPIL